jgi:hypothetical protein
MAYNAKVVQVMIASPSDVSEERQIVRELIDEWNSVHSTQQNVVLMAVGWETHSAPELAGRPQQIINERLLENSDLLIGIFWTRVGSPTGKSISGSVEEIEEHLKKGRPVMLYFSSVPVRLEGVDNDQYASLTAFKAWAKERGLIEEYETKDEFRDKLRRQLPILLRDNDFLRELLRPAAEPSAILLEDGNSSGSPRVGSDALQILKEAAADPDGMVLIHRYIGGSEITAGRKKMNEGNDRRTIARWEAAVGELHGAGYLTDINGKGEMFQITNEGYKMADG